MLEANRSERWPAVRHGPRADGWVQRAFSSTKTKLRTGAESRRLTFDLSGVPKARPLEGRVRPARDNEHGYGNRPIERDTANNKNPSIRKTVWIKPMISVLRVAEAM